MGSKRCNDGSLSPENDPKNIRIGSPVNTQDALLDVYTEVIQTSNNEGEYVCVKIDILQEILSKVNAMSAEICNLKQVNSEILKKLETKEAVHQNPTLRRQRNSHHLTPLAKKETVVPNWGHKFHKRRSEYRRHYHSLKKAEIITDFITNEKVYIIKKHRPNFSRVKEEYMIKERMSIHAMQVERDILLLNAEKAKANYEKIDSEIYNTIMKHDVEKERDDLVQQWGKEVQDAQLKGEFLCKHTLDFYSKLPETQPYLGYIEPTQNTSVKYNNNNQHMDDYYENRDHDNNNGNGNGWQRVSYRRNRSNSFFQGRSGQNPRQMRQREY